jgi:hypothetical protein
MGARDAASPILIGALSRSMSRDIACEKAITMNTSTLRTLKSAAVLAAAAGLMTLGAGAASAHVGVTPDSTSEGGFSQLTFRAPTSPKQPGRPNSQLALAFWLGYRLGRRRKAV